MLAISIILFLLSIIFSFILLKYIFRIVLIIFLCFIFFHMIKPSLKILTPFYSNEISNDKTIKNWLDTLK